MGRGLVAESAEGVSFFMSNLSDGRGTVVVC